MGICYDLEAKNPSISFSIKLLTGENYEVNGKSNDSFRTVLENFFSQKNPSIIHKINTALYNGDTIDFKKTLHENKIINNCCVLLIIDDSNLIQKDNNNYIIAEYIIGDLDIGKNIQIINSYESCQRSFNNFKLEEKCRNEKEIKECKIEIEGQIIPFIYSYKFKSSGIKKVKFIYTKSLKNINYLFYNVKKLKSIDLSNFNTQNVTNLSGMFAYCSSLSNINLSNFNTQNVTNLSNMFAYCSSLSNINLSNFNTQNVTVMSLMFFGCKSLINLDLSNFNTQNVTDMFCMFDGCDNLSISNLICYDEKILKNKSES